MHSLAPLSGTQYSTLLLSSRRSSRKPHVRPWLQAGGASTTAPVAGDAVTRQLASRDLATNAAIVLAVFGWLAATAGIRPLALPDEGRYVGVALEMLWTGDWLVPTLDTLPYFHKPPLFYWLTGASLAVFGINDWAARLPSLLAATGTAFALYVFVGRWAGHVQARHTLVVLATTPFFFGGAQFANLDMLVAACIACTILCAADAVLAGKADDRVEERWPPPTRLLRWGFSQRD